MKTTERGGGRGGFTIAAAWCGAIALCTQLSGMTTVAVAAEPSPLPPRPAAIQKPAAAQYPFGAFTVQVAAPRGWRELSEKGNTRVSLFSPDNRSVITLRLTPDHFPAGTLRNEKVRLIAKQRFPNAVVLGEAEWTNPDVKGRMIDFERSQKLQTGTPPLQTRTRLAAVPVQGGLLEVSFTAPAGEFTSHMSSCEEVLQTLRIRPVETPAPAPQLTAVTR